MGGRGVETLYLPLNSGVVNVFVRRNWENVFKDTWTGAIAADRNEDGTMSTFWKKMEMGVRSMDEAVKMLIKAKDIVARKIVAFRANGNMINVSELYTQKEKTEYICFFKKTGFKWDLYQVGAKTVDELKAVGIDSLNRSELPLIACSQIIDGKREFVFPNF
jgi:hypothetical protein